MIIKTAWLIINTNCNNRCSWCYGKFYQQESKQIEYNLLKKVIVFLNKLKCKKIVLIGGEPTLYPFLIKVIGLACEYGIESTIITNGRKLADINYLSKFKKYKDHVNFIISIEGSKEIHERITGISGSYSETIEGLRNCIKAGYFVFSNTTISKMNYNNLYDLFSKLSDYGLTNYSLNYAIHPLNQNYNINDFIPLNKIKYTLESIKDILLKKDTFLFFTTPLPLCVFKQNTIDDLQRNKIKINTVCQILTGQGITIDIEGNILPCSHFVDVPISNINKFKSLEEFELFWDNVLEKKYLQRIRKFPSKLCNNCSLNSICTGGCPIIWLYSDNTILEEVLNV